MIEPVGATALGSAGNAVGRDVADEASTRPAAPACQLASTRTSMSMPSKASLFPA